MLLGRGWATSTVDDISAGVDAKMAQVEPLVDASAKVSEINGRVGALTDAAGSAAKAAASPDLLGLRDQLANLQSRYLEFRDVQRRARRPSPRSTDSRSSTG